MVGVEGDSCARVSLNVPGAIGLRFLVQPPVVHKPHLTLILFTLPSASQIGSQVSTFFYPSVVNVGVVQLLSVEAYWSLASEVLIELCSRANLIVWLQDG